VLRNLIHPPRPATVIAVIALFAAVATSAYGLGKNTIGSKQIKNNSIKSADVKDNALTGQDISEATLNLPVGQGGLSVTTRHVYAPAGVATAKCNPGEKVIGGSAFPDNSIDTYAVSQPDPITGTPTGWQGVFNARANGTYSTGTVYVLCAT
jgi:hypothetical protein